MSKDDKTIKVSATPIYGLPKISGKDIGIIGGSGRVVKSFLTLLHHEKDKIPVTVYVKDTLSKAKIQTFATDLGLKNIIITTDLEQAQNCETTIFCAGAKTQNVAGQKTKEDLLQANKDLVMKLLSKTSKNKAIIVVTNPTTKLVPFIQELIQKPTYGMGVENDNIRFKRNAVSKDKFLIGAHNLAEMVMGSTSPISFYAEEFNKVAYKKVSADQDKFLKVGDMDNVLQHINSLPEEFKWYASQRLHSKLNDTTNACSEAIYNIFQLLTGKTDKLVVLETTMKLSINDTIFCCGWPFSPKTNNPVELHFPKKQIGVLESLQKMYKVKSNSYFLKPSGKRFV